jgi:chondroitin AC lyase
MAKAWYRTDSPHHRQEALLRAILLGLDGWYSLNLRNRNGWWWAQIGVPQTLAEVLLFIKDACPASYIERAAPSFAIPERSCPDLSAFPLWAFTGQNLVWVATLMIRPGILTDDPDRVTQGFTLVRRELRVLPDEEGIQPDMSFHQHEKVLYSGGYGQAFAADVGRLMAFAVDTPYAFSPPLVSLFARFVLDGSRWMVRGRTFDHLACGRETSRQGQNAGRFFEGLCHLASFAHPRQAEAREALAVVQSPGRSMVSGNRMFWNSDLMVQHRPEYYFSVRVPSRRIWTADWACNGEGPFCHHMADGVTMILRDGNEYRELFPVWNWRQIPGITMAQTAEPFDPNMTHVKGEPAFAGGASDGSVGCIAVDFSRDGLRARKAWFLFDDAMVALGTAITCPSAAPVRTTLNQCQWRGPVLMPGRNAPLTGGEYPLAPGVAFWHDGFAYRVLDGNGMLRLGAQTGAWSAIGGASADPVTLPVLNAGLDHGVQPDGATYAYAVCPSGEAAAAFAADPGRFVILRNEADIQAVWHAGAGRGHAVFYRPGAVTFPDGMRVETDRPCVLLYHPSKDGRLVFTLAQPEQLEGMITLRLTGRADESLGVSLPVQGYAGSSVTLLRKGER